MIFHCYVSSPEGNLSVTARAQVAGPYIRPVIRNGGILHSAKQTTLLQSVPAPMVWCFLSVVSESIKPLKKHQVAKKVDHTSNTSKDISSFYSVCQLIQGFIDALGGPRPRYPLKNHLGTPRLPWVLLFHTAEVAKPGRNRESSAPGRVTIFGFLWNTVKNGTI